MFIKPLVNSSKLYLFADRMRKCLRLFKLFKICLKLETEDVLFHRLKSKSLKLQRKRSIWYLCLDCFKVRKTNRGKQSCIYKHSHNGNKATQTSHRFRAALLLG